MAERFAQVRYSYDLSDLALPTEVVVRRLQRQQEAALRLIANEVERRLWEGMVAAVQAESLTPSSPYRFPWPPVTA